MPRLNEAEQKEEKEKQATAPVEQPPVQIAEVEVTLGLVNQKLNYLIANTEKTLAVLTALIAKLK